MLRRHDIQDLIERLERDGSHRVLRKLEVSEGRTGVPYNGGDTMVGVVVDVETTGLNPAKDVVIELAVRRFRHDLLGRILKIDTALSWCEDPGRPLHPEITRITGLTDAGLAGQQIDEAEATRVLRTAHLVIAHNAAFDRKFVERRLPGVAGLPWACTMCEVDWGAAGLEGKSLGWLGAQVRWFHDAHRASGDVDAVIGLLSHLLPDNRTILANLLEKSATPSVSVEAFGADYGVKDDLRERGYRWNCDRKVWSKIIDPLDLGEEQGWLGRKVYGPACRARASGPRITEITARERYA